MASMNDADHKKVRLALCWKIVEKKIHFIFPHIHSGVKKLFSDKRSFNMGEMSQCTTASLYVVCMINTDIYH